MNDSRTTQRARRSREPRRPDAPVCCGECETFHQLRWCPECGQQPPGVMVGVLYTEITTQAGDWWAVRAERDEESGGWVPVGMTRLPDQDTDEDTDTWWGA